MNTKDLLEYWTWNPGVLLTCFSAGAGLWWAFKRSARWRYLGAAFALLLIALFSPLNALANGVLFSAHMTQHILLLLIIPALAIAGLPRDFSLAGPSAGQWTRPRAARALPLAGWIAGVGSMWFWHVPDVCDAAATSVVVHTLQTLSLLGLGTVFWWPILAPSSEDRLSPPAGVAYLFTACLACTGLGIILTLTPIEVCPVFRSPLQTLNPLASYRRLLSAEYDRQIGGLLMWIPMCSVYLGAILLELSRWFGTAPTGQTQGTR